MNVRIKDFSQFLKEVEVKDFPNEVFKAPLGLGEYQTVLALGNRLYYAPTQYLEVV
jgi:hypothetical protein